MDSRRVAGLVSIHGEVEHCVLQIALLVLVQQGLLRKGLGTGACMDRAGPSRKGDTLHSRGHLEKMYKWLTQGLSKQMPFDREGIL